MPTKEQYLAEVVRIRRHYVKLMVCRFLICLPILIVVGLAVWGHALATFIWVLNIFLVLYNLMQDLLLIWYMKDEEQRLR